MKKLLEKVDIALIANTTTKDENFFYFTKLLGMWENSYAVISKNKVDVIAPPLEEGSVHIYSTKTEMEKLLKKYIVGDKIGYNGAKIPHNTLRYLKKIIGGKWVDISTDLNKLRAIKDKTEILDIKKACRISLDIVKNITFKDKTESQIAIEIENKMRNKNTIPSFDTIVAFGKNTASPHHIPNKKRYVYPSLVDLGAKYNGYSSDITRSYVNKKGKKLYELVYQALQMAIGEISDGVTASYVYDIIERFFDKYNYKMIHALGHSIGINVHDGYPISKNSKFKFKENMVFAIEPAIYLKNVGIRIEEDIIIGKTKSVIIR